MSNTQQPEALRLSHALSGGKLIDDSTEWADTLHAAATKLLRQHARIEELEAQLAAATSVVPQGYRLQPLSEYDAMCAYIAAAAPQPAEVECMTCNGYGAVGNPTNAEPCPDCTPPGHLADAAPMRMPEPDAWRYTTVRGHFRYRGRRVGFAAEYPMLKPDPLYTEQQVRALLAAQAKQGEQP